MDCQKIGDIIFKNRKQKNMTQKELANKLNISDRTVSKWERGLGCPDITLIIPLSKTLDISLYELLGGEDMDKQSKLKADKVLENTINSSANKLRRKNIIYTILLVISLLLIIANILFWGFYKFHYMFLYKPQNVKIDNLIEYKELLSSNSCVLTLENNECELKNGEYTHIVSIEHATNLPKWTIKDTNYGYNIDSVNNRMSVLIGEEDNKEHNINNFRFDKNYTKKSMIVISLVHFLFIEDLETIEFDFHDNVYLIEKEKINNILKNNDVEIEDLLINNNWSKHILKNLKNKQFINAFFAK